MREKEKQGHGALWSLLLADIVSKQLELFVHMDITPEYFVWIL